MFRVLVVNLALALVLTELVALGAYFLRTGKLYYLSPPSGRSVPVDITGGVEQYRLHPYFGFVNRPHGPVTHTNNYGFVSGRDFPYERRAPDEYVVGIFGGSVASAFARFESANHVLAPQLAAALELDADRITVLNFAQGGFKQPQQWLVYAYFRAIGQELDLVVNIDGFNEIALAGRNLSAGVALDMPSFDHLRALRDVTGHVGAPESIEQMLGIRTEWEKFARTFNRAWGGKGWELATASGFLVDFLIYKYHLWRYKGHLRSYSGSAGDSADDSWVALQPARGGEADPSQRAVELWARGSELLDRAQKDAGGVYLQFVQPNQYYDTGRVFSAEERAVAFSDESAFAEYVRRGYPTLAAAVEPLATRGVAVVSLLHLFDDVEEPVYKDDCCHYTDLGQRLLAHAIAESFSRHVSGS